MKKSAFFVPVLLGLSGLAQAQEAPACPQLPADSGLTWEHRGSAGADFCRALRSDGSEAFGLYIAKTSPFEPKRGNRAEVDMIDGREIYWYRSELASKPDVQAREALLELGDGRKAHIWLQAGSADGLNETFKQTRGLHFSAALLSSN